MNLRKSIKLWRLKRRILRTVRKAGGVYVIVEHKDERS